MELRPYQQSAVEAVESGWSGARKQLLVAATGSGKTIMFSALCGRQQGRCLVLVHREELLLQAADKIRRTINEIPAVERGDERASLSARLVVATVQTVRRRLAKYPPDHFALIICDEAHLSTSAEWRTVLDHFAPARVVGVTATPQREDQRKLGAFYENIAFEIGLFDLIRGGFLAPIKVRTVPISIDLNGATQRAGDFDDGDLDLSIAPYYRSIAQSVKKYAADRRTLAFLPLIKSSQQFVSICQEEGITAQHVDGASPDRRDILRAFSAGQFQLLANAQLLTTGYDEPAVSCILNLRPTRSKILFQQIVGRGTRLCEGKTDLLLLDFLWQFNKLGKDLVRPAHLVATNDADAVAIQKRLYHGDTLDLGETQSQIQRERDEELARELARRARSRSRFFDAAEWAARLHFRQMADYQPTMPWHSRPVEPFQRRVLELEGFDLETVTDKGAAAAIVNMIYARNRSGMSSFRQMRELRAAGVDNPEHFTRSAAEGFLRGERHPVAVSA